MRRRIRSRGGVGRWRRRRKLIIKTFKSLLFLRPTAELHRSHKNSYIQALQNLSRISRSLGSAALCAHIVAHCLEALVFNL